ncbi:alanine racemase [Gudongella sp. DL1XJH-153]|uniref:alanine racemase n=1 Tax=Gudongella sp. DL1XJH-153 TaxID=3409804 RepID=UPI003BB79138
MNNHIYNSWLEINLDYLKNNIEQIRGHIGTECEIMAVVKSNAYGHGAVTIVKYLQKNCNIKYFSVANIWEALELRREEIDAPILVMSSLMDSQLEEAVKNDITITLFNSETAKKIDEIGKRIGKRPRVHIKIDSGLRRIGLIPGEELQAFAEQIKSTENLDIEGVYSHFAESGNEDKTFTYEQLGIFNEGVSQLRENGIDPKYIHCAASQAILEVPESHFNLVRSGKLTYGYHGMSHENKTIELKPILSWKSAITNILELKKGESIGYSRTFTADKDMKVAVVSVGFGDGYSSLLSNKGSIIINGIKAPIIGRICMDSTFIDITGLDDVRIGDVVTILGREGDAEITKNEICSITGQQVSEIIANIGRRVGRFYTGNSSNQTI